MPCALLSVRCWGRSQRDGGPTAGDSVWDNQCAARVGITSEQVMRNGWLRASKVTGLSRE